MLEQYCFGAQELRRHAGKASKKNMDKVYI
jgi:hypothetical protein